MSANVSLRKLMGSSNIDSLKTVISRGINIVGN